MTDRAIPKKPEPLALMACKVIMRARVSGAANSVGAVLLDHVNWQDLRCDPGLPRIALLSGHSRSSVQAGIDQLIERGILSVRLHGGRSGRNRYDFHWDEIRRRDSLMQTALHPGRRSPGKQGMPRPETRAQTRLLNPCTEPVAAADREPRPEAPDRHKGPARRTTSAPKGLVSGRGQQATLRGQAAATAAERRWSHDLLVRLGPQREVYVAIVAAIDESIRQAATEAELSRRGTGASTVLDLLARAATSSRSTVARDAGGSSSGTAAAGGSSLEQSVAPADFQSLKSKPKED